ncbi:TadE/TadG family type IV pilus assembly protein [Sphingomonas sp. RB3P16]|uniref:TadE/TadG family type IV pilus assembly protein n=1 Tax=Parasphingomonas frigoris TaxID=3096163 RepID=UPI002FCBDD7F
MRGGWVASANCVGVTHLQRISAFWRRFGRDVAGNTLAIMAAALIPMAGLVGGGIDISRMYIIKTRMQHACDAGALAGRKQMGGGIWGSDDNDVALQYYDANFQANGYGSTGTTRAFSAVGGTVSGTATATVPMTLMRVLGITTDTITVTCDSEMRLPNTDVMFVLDVTGSMNCPATSTTCTNNGGVPAAGSKIDGLKTAVKCFYEIVARLKTNATCATTNATGGTGDQVQIRFGFMPYASNVNVGYSLPPAYLADTWSYQSRSIKSIAYPTNGTPTQTSTSTTNNGAGNWQNKTTSKGSIYSGWTTWCQTNVPATTTTNGTPTTTTTSTTTYQGYRTVTYKIDTPVTTTEYRYNSTGLFICYYDSRTTTNTNTTNYTRNDAAQVTWHYGKISQSVAGLKNGTSWNSSLAMPIGPNGTDRTVGWDGCIQERPTVATTNYTPIPSAAYDLNIDLVPTSTNANSLWGPSLPDAIYLRNISSYWSEATTVESDTTNDYYNSVDDYCPTAAQKLRSWTDPTTFDDYVDSLVAQGNTYHDIGMLWGARFMSPTGVFASENAVTLPTANYSGGADIQRHMIFMTDGDSTSNPCDYNAYGVPFYDQKQTTDVGPASSCPSNRQALIDQINLRLSALCTSVKNMNITLWVISFGNGTNAATEARLQGCATSPSYYFKATDSAALQTQFATIANNISALRLTR